MNIFRATVYLELEQKFLHDLIKGRSKVEVFGEFYNSIPWTVRIPCTFDHHFNCFKADIEIRSGMSFKFIIDDGKWYAISKRYSKVRDCYQNENNYYDPKKIVWTTEKRSLLSKQNNNKYFQVTEDMISVNETNSESYNESDFIPNARANFVPNH